MLEEEIFYEALEKEGPARAIYLDSACGGNCALRSQVEALLKAHGEPRGFLTAPLATSASHLATTWSADFLGTKIGSFKIREQIGEGGMGIVFVAEQTTPVRRKVAIKVIRPDVATEEVVSRFQAERQALALMDHPHIARVIDGGETKGGLPYLVMELVHGVPITEYCDKYQLSIDERLKLFEQVCEAVHHAHQKGIIHRDLKPTNVLISRIDGKPVAKVIDFGVAKAINERLSDHTIYTQFSQVLGSPLYMSPEQAEIGVADVDVRSDVYSLGVLLYELLAGSTPIDRGRLRRAGFDEMRRVIREEEPPRPSGRISTLNAEQASTICSNRGTEHHELSSRLKSEVDWVVMKAIEKDRARRYQSVADFSKDIQRYLNNEAVHACPPSIPYRLRKYVTRHRARVAVALTIFVASILGVLGLIGYNLTIAKQRDIADAMRVRAERQTQIAETNLQLAKDTVDEWYVRFGDEWLSKENGKAITAEQAQLLERAADFYETYVSQNNQPQSQLEQARLLDRLSRVKNSLGEKEAARSYSGQAVEITKNLIREEPRSLDLRLDLSTFQTNLARASASLDNDLRIHRVRLSDLQKVPQELQLRPKWREAFANVCSDIAFVAWSKGDLETADEHGSLALDAFAKLHASNPNNPDYVSQRSHILYSVLRSRLEWQGVSVTSGKLRPEFSREESAALFREALHLARDRYKQAPESKSARSQFANIASLSRYFLPPVEAEPLLLERLELAKQDLPARYAVDNTLNCLHLLERFYAHAMQFEKALNAAEASLQLALEHDKSPSVENYDLVATHLGSLKRYREAIAAYERKIDFCRAVAKDDESKNPRMEYLIADTQIDLGNMEFRLAAQLLDQGNVNLAVERAENAHNRFELGRHLFGRIQELPDGIDSKPGLSLETIDAEILKLVAPTWAGFARQLWQRNLASEASTYIRRSMKAYEELSGQPPSFNASALAEYAWLLVTWPDRTIHDPKLALELTDKALNASINDDVSMLCHRARGLAFYRIRSWQKCVDVLNESISRLDGSKRQPTGFEWFPLAIASHHLDQHTEARRYFQLASDWYHNNDPEDFYLNNYPSEAEQLFSEASNTFSQ